MERLLVRGEWRDGGGRKGLNDHKQSKDRNIRHLVTQPSFDVSCKNNTLARGIYF